MESAARQHRRRRPAIGRRFASRLAPRLAWIVAAAAGLGGATAAPPPAPAAATGRVAERGTSWLSGIWINAAPPGTARTPITTVDGGTPPLRPEAARLLAGRRAAAARGQPFPTTVEDCLPGGVPRSLFTPGAQVEFVETPGQVTILVQQFSTFRTILLDAPHDKDADPGYLGDSIGRWEGDTLVVDTIALNDLTTLDAAGTPHSEALHVTERFRRLPDGRLQVDALLDDPRTFTRPWTARTTFRRAPPGTIMGEGFCASHLKRAGIVVPAPGRQGMRR